MKKHVLRVQVKEEGKEVRPYDFSQAVVKVGNLPSSHLRLEGVDVARMHAVIEVDGPDSATVLDLGSQAGTRVNDKPIARATVRAGDVIRAGGATISVISVGLQTGGAPTGKILVDDRAATKRIAAALAAFEALEPAERRVVFSKFSECRCAKLDKMTSENPAATIGGVLGAVLAESLFPSRKAPPTKVRDVVTAPSGDVLPKKEGP